MLGASLLIFQPVDGEPCGLLLLINVQPPLSSWVIELSGGSKPSFKEAAAAHEKDKEHNIAVEDSNLQSLRDTFSIFLTPVLRVVNLYQTELNFLSGNGHQSPERFDIFLRTRSLRASPHVRPPDQ
jgi:hypothetical protein